MTSYRETFPAADGYNIASCARSWYEPLAGTVWYVNSNRLERRENNVERRLVFDGATVDDDQWAEVILSGLTQNASSQWGPIVRSTITTTNSCYVAFYSNGAIYLYLINAGSYTALRSYPIGTQTAGTLRLEVVDSTLRVYWNGSREL